MKNQIKDAEILGINKVESVGSERLLEICLLLRRLNPKTRMIPFSALREGENLYKSFGMLEEASRDKKIPNAKKLT